MCRRIVTLIAACALAASLGLSVALGAAAPEAAATDAGEAAVAYSNALALGNVDRAWNLLSATSKQGLTKEQYQAAFGAPRATPKPPASTVLRAIAAGSESPTVGGVMVRGENSYVHVKGDVQVTQTVVLVKEPGGWRVDLGPTDEANSRDAAELALAAEREQGPAPARGQRPDVSLPMLRIMLRSEAKNYKVLKTEVSGDQATVSVGADVPVSVVFQEVRSGAGWTVRTLAPVDILSEDPLRDALLASEQQECENQLRQIGAAIQMYASRSDDMLPDPARWLDQIRPYLREPSELHCPADPGASGVSYAMNSNLAGKRRRDVGNPSTVPMVFESTAHGPNVANAGESWPHTAWHKGGVMVLYADGSVRQTPQKPSFAVPPPTPGAATRPTGTRPQGRPGGPGTPIRPRPQGQTRPAR
jgi:prepilin-type processing-associated H-X9-DG protein